MKRIEVEIAQGRLGVARDRLHGLIASYPCDISLRSQLGDVYARLGYPVSAGQFWYLENEIAGEKKVAVDAFLNDCSNDPVVILRRLRVRCEPGRLSDAEAGRKVADLIAECAARGVFPPDFKHAPGPVGCRDRLINNLCLGVFLVLLAFMLIGFATAVDWITRLFQGS